jgi:hypothetical protein
MIIQVYCQNYFNRADAFYALLDLFIVAQVTLKVQACLRIFIFPLCVCQGDVLDHGSLVKAVKSADIVISAVGPRQVGEQTRIIAAIKEAGNVKVSIKLLLLDCSPPNLCSFDVCKSLKNLFLQRFVPSEFGSDVDRLHTVDPAASLYAVKANLRRLIEAEGIPHTYISCNCFAETYLPSIGDVTAIRAGPPATKITVLGDGSAKGN